MTRELSAVLIDHDLFLYVGHGSGMYALNYAFFALKLCIFI